MARQCQNAFHLNLKRVETGITTEISGYHGCVVKSAGQGRIVQ